MIAVSKLLIDLVTNHGEDILQQPQRLKAMLADLFPNEKRLRFLLELSFRAEIPAKLKEIQQNEKEVREAKTNSLKHYFKEEYFLEEKAVEAVFECLITILVECKTRNGFLIAYESDNNNHLNGKYYYIFNNGNIYEGDFVDGKRTGKGTFTWADGDFYEGDWVNDERTGKGTYNWVNGDVYEGDWVNAESTGKGTFTWADGDVYEGDWLNDERTGKGTFTWVNGDVYEGDWVNDKRTGIGKYIWASGDVYEGDWLNDERAGKGTITWVNGNVYEGDFVDGKRTGKGTFTWVNGDVYEGDFDNGKRTGKGTYTHVDKCAVIDRCPLSEVAKSATIIEHEEHGTYVRLTLIQGGYLDASVKGDLKKAGAGDEIQVANSTIELVRNEETGHELYRVY